MRRAHTDDSAAAKSQRDRRSEQKRAAKKRWLETPEGRERQRAYNRAYAKSAKAKETLRRWHEARKAAQPELVRAAWCAKEARRKERDPEKFRAKNAAKKRRRRVRNPEKERAKDRRKRLRCRPLDRAREANIIARIRKSTPASMPRATRDEVLSMAFLGILEGRFPTRIEAKHVREVIREHFREYDTFKTISLDAVVADGATRGQLLGIY